MINLPKNTVLGQLEIVSIFQFFDIPRLFTCKNKAKTQFLAISTFDDDEIYEWLYLPISNDRLSSIIDNRISLRDAFIYPEDGYLFNVIADYFGVAEVKYVLPEQISNNDLPDEGVFLDAEDNIEVGLGDIDAKSAAISSKRETFNIHLYPSNTRLPELDIKPLGKLLNSFQDLVDSLGQYKLGEPTLTGLIAADILEATKFKATQIFNGSFGIQLKSSSTIDLLGDSLASDAILELIYLLEIGDNEDNLSNKLHILKGRVASTYRKFLKEVSSIDSPLKIDWASPNLERDRCLYLNKQIIKNTYKLVSKIDIDMSESVTFKVELLGLDVEVKTFRVRHVDGNELYSGKIAEEAIEQVKHSEINAYYDVTLKKVIKTNSSSGSEYTKWILFGLKSNANSM